MHILGVGMDEPAPTSGGELFARKNNFGIIVAGLACHADPPMLCGSGRHGLQLVQGNGGRYGNVYMRASLHGLQRQRRMGMARRKDRNRINPDGEKLVQIACSTCKAKFRDESLCPLDYQIGDIQSANAGVGSKHCDKMGQELSRSNQSKANCHGSDGPYCLRLDAVISIVLTKASTESNKDDNGLSVDPTV